MKNRIPIPYDLSQWGDRTEIFYKCPKCGCDLRLLGQRQKYCYECGEKFDWEFCLTHVTKETRDIYIKADQSFFNNDISYEEKEQIQNDIMFEIYEFACKKRREYDKKFI